MEKKGLQQGFFPSTIFSHPFFSFPSILEEKIDPTDWSNSGLSISENDENFTLEAQMPGLEAENIDITVDRGVVTIRGERKEESEEKKKWHKKASYSFFYKVAIPGEINEKDASAFYDNGIMTITFKKSSGDKAKKIAVKKGKK